MAAPTLSAEHVAAAFDAPTAAYLGSGTFGETWKVECELDGERAEYAVKLLRPEYFRVHLVAREVNGLLEFDDPGIVKLHSVREVEIAGTAHTALLCEYIAGGDVITNLRSHAPSHSEAIAFARSLMAAVAVVHGADRVHRDLKLENIILRDGDWAHPVLIDFGLSKGAGDATQTLYPSLVGSRPFMSPEQLAGERARKQSDLWACGVIIYFVLAMRHPFIDDFRGLSEDDIADLVAGPPRPLPDETPSALADVVLRLLSEEPFARGTAKRAAKDIRKASK
ncbi:serine/threonine-protein kinase [Leifsonia poae]|uniref:serine/threonine-protein kinase n=1 Tax=Leifsonia poae TaxID=110933 RepID=UPI001CBE7121|nr:serine/threonine-protein kinase [Leifsonia poae]